jgi:putative aldouronate transport system permease protein
MYALFVYSLRNRKLKSVVQTVSFIPYFLSWTACSGFLYAIISDYGILNSILVKLGVEAVSWYGETDAWWGILSISSLWKGMGWGTLIYIAAMCNIDNELYEASALDGCGAIRQMFTVTIPGIMPAITMTFILCVAGIVKDDFEHIYALVGDSSILSDTTEVLGTWVYKTLHGGFRGWGDATAVGLVQSVAGALLMAGSNWLVRKQGQEGLW